MRKIYYRTDFDLCLDLYSASGEVIGWPACDFTALLYTTSPRAGYLAGASGGATRNCVNSSGRVRVILDGHRLQPGPLKCDFSLFVPDRAYPDGFRRVTSTHDLGIELTSDPAALPSDIGAELPLPVLPPDGTGGDACGCSAIAEADILAIFDEEPSELPGEALTFAEIDDVCDDGIAQSLPDVVPGEARIEEYEIDRLLNPPPDTQNTP